MNYQPEFKPAIKKYVYDDGRDWSERYDALDDHHQKETALLMQEINRLRKIINDHVAAEVDKSSRKGYPWD